MHAFTRQPKVTRPNTSAGSTLFGRAHSGYSSDARRSPHTNDKPAVQTKLAVNKPGDGHEREADRVAERLMNAPEPSVTVILAALVKSYCTAE